MTEKKPAVLVVGELNVDLILNQLDKFPETGKEIIARQMAFTLGSSSAIFASNLAALGTPVSFLGKVGKDSFADKILTDLSEKGVDVRHILHSDTADTGVTVAFNFNEDRAMVTYPGAMNELREEDISEEVLASSTHLHVSSIFLQPGLRPGLVKLFQRAKKAGLTTSLDPQWDPAEKWDGDWKALLPEVDLFMPNLEELKNIAGEQDLDICIDILKDHAQAIIIKNGKEGAVCWERNKLLEQPSFINTEVVDAVGAGDSFNAGFIHRFVKGKPMRECMEFGALCGALNTTGSGGTGSFRDHESIKRIALQKFNYTIHDL